MVRAAKYMLTKHHAYAKSLNIIFHVEPYIAPLNIIVTCNCNIQRIKAEYPAC